MNSAFDFTYYFICSADTQYLHQRQYCMMKMTRRKIPERRVAAPRPAKESFRASLSMPMHEPEGLPFSTL